MKPRIWPPGPGAVVIAGALPDGFDPPSASLNPPENPPEIKSEDSGERT